MDKQDARREAGDENPKLAEAARETQQFVGQLQSAKLARAVTSERQLNEVMVDFWENHFSVFAGQGPDAPLSRAVRSRRDSSARDGQVPRSARRRGEESGDAVLPRQLAERRRQHAADAGRTRRRSRRTRGIRPASSRGAGGGFGSFRRRSASDCRTQRPKSANRSWSGCSSRPSAA